ncbi:hypothetical protein B0J17DRAFT_754058 [Rhizoctonia solani]|nr:hypothetical protein B0J17DRAFT_754058 [Rhizoctonia solani]
MAARVKVLASDGCRHKEIPDDVMNWRSCSRLDLGQPVQTKKANEGVVVRGCKVPIHRHQTWHLRGSFGLSEHIAAMSDKKLLLSGVNLADVQGWPGGTHVVKKAPPATTTSPNAHATFHPPEQLSALWPHSRLDGYVSILCGLANCPAPGPSQLTSLNDLKFGHIYPRVPRRGRGNTNNVSNPVGQIFGRFTPQTFRTYNDYQWLRIPILGGCDMC